MRSIRIILFSVIIFPLLFNYCSEDEPTSPSKKDPITMENILGTWYHLFHDAESGIKMVIFLDNRSDSTATVGMMNGPTEVSLLEINYYVDNGVYIFIAPEVDTSNQNALQIMFADEMGGFIYADEIYLQEGKLHFVEGEQTYVFSKTIPSIPGGTITGSLAVIGEFGQGAAIIVGYDPVNDKMGGTFSSQPGPYYLQGLADGSYYVIAVYIPKEHALDWMDQDITNFPNEARETLVVISGSNTVSNIDFTLDLSNVEFYKYSINKDTREYKIAAKCFQLLKNLDFFTE